jgi:hypothetical protein
MVCLYFIQLCHHQIQRHKKDLLKAAFNALTDILKGARYRQETAYQVHLYLTVDPSISLSYLLLRDSAILYLSISVWHLSPSFLILTCLCLLLPALTYPYLLFS